MLPVGGMAEEPNEAEGMDGGKAASADGPAEDAEARAAVAPIGIDTAAPAPGAIAGASQLPPASIEAIEAIASAVSRLRDEVDATTDRARKARLLNEAGEIQERGGDEP